tara:strand:- start:733 stop:945 length:213 start_codon:yes stop_codon:yes gene_type:complete
MDFNFKVYNIFAASKKIRPPFKTSVTYARYNASQKEIIGNYRREGDSQDRRFVSQDEYKIKKYKSYGQAA